MMKHVDLQTKADKTDEDINNLDDIKAELRKMNNVASNLCLQAGVEASKASVNMHNLAKRKWSKLYWE